jgi:glycosyltransferase involved in cell wall biosynthesis
MSNHVECIAREITSFVVDQCERVIRAYFPGWRIPIVFGGHQIGPDVQADIAFTLKFLYELGVQQISGLSVVEVITTVLRSIDDKRPSPFGSYRIAETLACFGTFDRNDILANWPVSDREKLAAACDTREAIIEFKAGKLSQNYSAVLARSELARSSLGLISHDDSVLDSLLRRTAEIMSANPTGYLDDSLTGNARYDIYLADLYLFSEPFADRLGVIWDRGARSAISLVEHTVTGDGTAFPWGRSSGALATCMTIELGALALRNQLASNPAQWLTFVQTAFTNVSKWFSETGVISAHQYRSTYRYRDIHRLLQMTFDCLGKLAWSAVALKAAAPSIADEAAPFEIAFPEQDELIWFDEKRKAGVWCYRSRGLSFVLPIVGSTLNDYLPVPHYPGLFEVPVETDLPTGIPFAFDGVTRFVPGNLPIEVIKFNGGLRLRYDGYSRSAQWEAPDSMPRLSGNRTVTYEVNGRTLNVDEYLRFDKRPDAVALQIAETMHRPLAVEFNCPTRHAATKIETKGLREYRSFWAELPLAHQLDIDPIEAVRFSFRVTPLIRVLAFHHHNHYHRTIYNPLVGRVYDGMPSVPEVSLSALQQWDLLHLHWPEFLWPDLNRHLELINALSGAAVPIIWTQHNLLPHSKNERFIGIYEAWAAAASGVIHHSYWGMEQVLARFRFRNDAIHRVIPHPHFGPLMEGIMLVDRKEVEAEFGLTSGLLRLGIVGTPRREKQIGMVVDAFTACGREDLELFILSLEPGTPAPNHPRIVARPYENVPREIYNRYLRAIDLLVLPFANEGMLTTGIVGDAIGIGVPALISDWPFLYEVLGEAGIHYGSTLDDLIMCLQKLDSETIACATVAARKLQAIHDPARVAELTFELLEATIMAR